MDLVLPPTTRPFSKTVSVPGDKSLAHRAALFAAVATGESVVANFPQSGVTRAMLRALAALGVESSWERGVLRVRGNGFRPFPASGAVAFCGNSATTIRLLAGAVAGTRSAATLDASEGLRKRPMGRIADPLRKMGAAIETTGGFAPLSLVPAALRGITYELPVPSAQVLSCLQLAALGADGESRFRVPGPVRDHTTRMLRAMGAKVFDHDAETVVEPLTGQGLTPLSGTLPGDLSSAAFLFAAAACVPGSAVTVTRVGVNPTRTGILDVLTRMGARVACEAPREEMGEPVADVTVQVPESLHGIEIAGDLVVRSIDEFPAIAAVAACADGITTVHDAKELRYKETDRIAALVSQLRLLGAEVEEWEDGFAIRGGTLRGGRVRANGDHRLAMSLALCGLRVPVTVEGAEILDESFPGFVPTMRTLLGM